MIICYVGVLVTSQTVNSNQLINQSGFLGHLCDPGA